MAYVSLTRSARSPRRFLNDTRSSEMRINIRQIARAPLLLYRQQSIGENKLSKWSLLILQHLPLQFDHDRQ